MGCVGVFGSLAIARSDNFRPVVRFPASVCDQPR